MSAKRHWKLYLTRDAFFSDYSASKSHIYRNAIYIPFMYFDFTYSRIQIFMPIFQH